MLTQRTARCANTQVLPLDVVALRARAIVMVDIAGVRLCGVKRCDLWHCSVPFGIADGFPQVQPCILDGCKSTPNQVGLAQSPLCYKLTRFVKVECREIESLARGLGALSGQPAHPMKL